MIRMIAYRFCDVCRVADPDAETLADDAATIRFDVGNRPLRVDVCAEHSDPTWQMITTAAIADLERSKSVARAATRAPAKVAAAAAAANGSTANSDPGTCAMCGDHFEWLSMHITAKHKLKPRGTRAGEVKCPLCDETRGNNAALSRHVANDHERRLMHVLAEQQAS